MVGADEAAVLIVPRLASVFSAFGAASADVRRDGARTVLVSLPVDAALLERTFAELEAEVIGQLRARTDARVPIEVSREADLRFTRQNWEVTVALPSGRIDEHAVRQLEQAFLDKYERLYGKGLALRESGIVLAAAWGAIRLREAKGRRDAGWRIAAALLVVLGAALLAAAR